MTSLLRDIDTKNNYNYKVLQIVLILWEQGPHHSYYNNDIEE